MKTICNSLIASPEISGTIGEIIEEDSKKIIEHWQAQGRDNVKDMGEDLLHQREN